MNELREYHRDLALACLSRSPGPMTAAELAEVMGTLAQEEGHPRACWRSITGPMVAGIMKTLLAAGEVSSTPSFHARHGRDVALWAKAQPGTWPFPLPPEDDEPEEAPAPASPYDHLSREQLVALLGVHDELSALVARFQQELSEFTAGARTRLAAVGARG